MPLFDISALDVIAAGTDTCRVAADGFHCTCWLGRFEDCCWCGLEVPAE